MTDGVDKRRDGARGEDDLADIIGARHLDEQLRTGAARGLARLLGDVDEVRRRLVRIERSVYGRKREPVEPVNRVGRQLITDAVRLVSHGASAGRSPAARAPPAIIIMASNSDPERMARIVSPEWRLSDPRFRRDKTNKRWFRPIGCLPLTAPGLDFSAPSAPPCRETPDWLQRRRCNDGARHGQLAAGRRRAIAAIAPGHAIAGRCRAAFRGQSAHAYLSTYGLPS